jgi:hypothetical protein
MATKRFDKPTITIELGISVESHPAIYTLRQRARQRAAVTAAGQPDLAFLVESDFPEKMPLDEVDGKYVITGPLPIFEQARMFPADENSVTGRNAAATRDDEGEQEAIDRVVEAVAISSTLLDEVALLMQTSPHVKAEIERLEAARGVDTRPARNFVYQKQEQFTVTIEDEVVHFNAHASRTAVTAGTPSEVLMTPTSVRDEGLVIKGQVNATKGDGRNTGVQSGCCHEFRFGKLEPWQAAVIELARQKQLPILMTSVETIGTCSLNPLPVDVQEVLNFPVLLLEAINDFSAAAERLKRA